MRLGCSANFYGEVRNYPDKDANNANVDTTAEMLAIFHGVKGFTVAYIFPQELTLF